LSGAQAGHGGSITLPVQTFVGRVETVTKSDLPRFELVTPVRPPIQPTGFRPGKPPVIGVARYVLLVPGDAYRSLADAAKPNPKGFYPSVRVKGALVYVPGVRGMAKAIVVQGVEILKS
jgi:hypothetical protein